MAFPASTDSEPSAQVAQAHPVPVHDLDAYYAVGVHIYKGGHACLTLTHLDMRTRRIITERLHCSELVPATRASALHELWVAVTGSLADIHSDLA